MQDKEISHLCSSAAPTVHYTLRNLCCNVPLHLPIPSQVVGEDDKYIYITLQILPIPSAADYPNPRSPDDVVQDLVKYSTSDNCLPFTIDLPSSGEKMRPCWVEVDPVCPIPPSPSSTSSPGELFRP